MPDLSRDVVPASERPLDAVLDAAATLTAIVTVDGELAHWEGPWRPDGATWFDAIPEGEHFAAREALSRAANGGAPVEVDLNFRVAGGEVRPVGWRMAAPDGGLSCVIATGVDTAERARIEQQLHDLVGRDTLTGLLDRRRFEAELERHVARGRRYGNGGALVVLDLNQFRSINEEHGTRAGDRVLFEVAKSLTNRLRETDLLARIGGDQFGVLLPQATPPEAERVCQALEDAIPAEVRAPGDRLLEASVGFVPFTDTMNSVEEALLAAHAAMYAVKAGQPRHIRRLRPL
jgi:diguanylate cyclase (GGDEF)-like protein